MNRTKYSASVFAGKVKLHPEQQLGKPVANLQNKCGLSSTPAHNSERKQGEFVTMRNKRKVLAKENVMIRKSLKEMNEFLSQFIESIKESKLKKLSGMGYKYG